MAKGLPRSQSRGSPQRQDVVRQRIRVAHNIEVDGAVGDGFGTVVIGDLPEGNILLLGAIGYIQALRNAAAGVLDTFTATVSLGTAPTADATLSGGEIDLLAATSLGAASGGASALTRLTPNVTQAMLDNTDGSLELNLNMTVADAGISANDQIMRVVGYIDLCYAVMGDD